MISLPIFPPIFSQLQPISSPRIESLFFSHLLAANLHLLSPAPFLSQIFSASSLYLPSPIFSPPPSISFFNLTFLPYFSAVSFCLPLLFTAVAALSPHSFLLASLIALTHFSHSCNNNQPPLSKSLVQSHGSLFSSFSNFFFGFPLFFLLSLTLLFVMAPFSQPWPSVSLFFYLFSLWIGS
ncbi:hypothetical protein NE237_008933 [Protea cynaroides]|uniref:Uncharacterized protein n=1 Tax=Protea cynaroides TaxID=273540 RepID=A0A9Q0KWL6_9MAGN|nr:hypothetical protein NE237_008933 [Protea cynaroides]